MIRFGMHSSLWTASWTKEAAEMLIPEAARYGLEVIEIALLTPETVDVEHSRALFKAHGVAPTASLCLPMEDNAALHPERAERFLMPALEVAHALGCNILGGVTYSTLGWRSGRPPEEQELANIAKALKPVARRAAEYGMLIGIEPCNRYETHLLNTAEQSLAMLERIGEKNVTIHLDTYHMNIEEKGIGHGIAVAGAKSRYIHLSESDRGVPGTGTIDWDETFRALAVNGFDGDLVMESFVTLPPEIASALSVWRSVARDRYEVLDHGVPYLKSLATLHGLVGSGVRC
jgi:D-psicose/D-tagatose/L-ribulose 3-epimerase